MNSTRLSLVFVLLFVMGTATGFVLSSDGLKWSSDEGTFAIEVDTPEGTNAYVLVEVDEGDNDEETVIDEILHEFTFSTSGPSGLIVWDFGDGFTATGSQTSHAFAQPGVYTVTATRTDETTTEVQSLTVAVHRTSTAEVDNMECVCAPTAKDTVIVLADSEGKTNLQGFVRVEHDGSSESCSLRNPLQECHLRVLWQRLDGGNLIEENVLFDDTFRSNEQVVDFSVESLVLEPGQRIQLRLETEQVRDWHKPNAAWTTSAPVLV